jgi:hypothetical protein
MMYHEPTWPRRRKTLIPNQGRWFSCQQTKSKLTAKEGKLKKKKKKMANCKP